MDCVQIPIDRDGAASWRQRCNERIRKLKAQQFSHPTLQQKELSSEKNFIAFELFEAVKNGNSDSFVDIPELQESAQEKLSLAAIFDEATRAGSSLLHVAAHFGSENIAELSNQQFPELLSKRNIRGDTALHVAARATNSSVMKIILSQYAAEKSKSSVEIDEAEDFHGMRILKGNEDEELPSIKNEYWNTALHEAVCSNHFDGVECLFYADQLVAHCRNKEGISPLCLAVSASDEKIFNLLLHTPFQTGEPLPAFYGNSPLHVAISKRKSVTH